MLESIKTITQYLYNRQGRKLICIVALIFLGLQIQCNDTLRWHKTLSQRLYNNQFKNAVDSFSNYYLSKKQYKAFLKNSLERLTYHQINSEYAKTEALVSSLKDSLNNYFSKNKIDSNFYNSFSYNLEYNNALRLYTLEKYEKALESFNLLLEKIEDTNLDSIETAFYKPHFNKYVASMYQRLDRYYEALPILKTILKNSEDDPLNMINLAHNYKKIGDTNLANFYFNKAEEINIKTKNPISKNHIYISLLKQYILANDANKVQELSIYLKKNIIKESHRFSLELLMYNFHFGRNEMQAAKDILFKIKPDAKNSNASSIRLNHEKIKFHLHKEDFKKAEEHLEVAFDSLKIQNIESLENKNIPLNNIDLVLESLFYGLEIQNKKINNKTNSIEVAIGRNYAEEIYDFITDVRSKIRSDLDKKLSNVSFEKYYNALIEFAYSNNDSNLLWKYLSLSNNYSISFTRLYRSYLKEVSNTESFEKYNKLYNEIIDLESKEKKYPDSIELSQILVNKRDQYLIDGKVESINKKLDANLAESTFVKNIQKQLNEDECIISYYTTERFIYKMNINSEDIQIVRTQTIDDIEKYINCLSDYNSNYEKAIQNLSVLTTDLSLKEKITIIPHGILNCIPFEALIDSNAQELIRNHIISYQYKWEENIARNKYAQNASSIAPAFDSCSSFSQLIHNTVESEHVKKALGIPTELIDHDINKTLFFKACADSDILHFASHAFIDNSSPYNSYLSLGETCDKNSKASKIYTTDILKHTLSNELIVLSSCDSGNGKLIKGEGLESLAKAFFSTSVKSVISTLWSVNDQSSSEIMKYFYTELSKGKAKNVALRDAKLKFLDHHGPDYHHPYYWAGFVPFGDMSPVMRSNNYILYGSIMLVLFAGIYFLRKRKTKQSSQE